MVHWPRRIRMATVCGMDNDITFKRTFSHHVMVRHLLDWFVGELQDGGRELVDRLDLAKLRRLNEQTVGGRPASLHRFAGDGYLDIHRLGADDFRDDNAVSLLAELTNPPPTPRTARLAASLLEVLAGEQPELRQVLFEWIRQESGLDLGVHEMERVERLNASAREDFLEDRVELWCDRLRAEGMESGRAEGFEIGRAEGVETGRAEGVETGRAEGIEAGRAEERELLVRQAELKFDSATARRLAELLSRTDNPASLAEVGAWIITCTTAEDLLARAARSGGNP